MNLYCNPVSFSDGKRHTNPDPFILKWCGKYYCYATDEFGVKVSVSKDMISWEYKGYAIKEEEYRDYWAPSVLYENGVFYMYYSNKHLEEEDGHGIYLKLAVSSNPEGPYIWKKTFFDKFSIDSHPVMWNGELYMLYSVNDWIGTEDKIAGTCILIDKMNSPEEFAGDPKAVVLPTLSQEIYEENRFGDGRDWYTIEGACPIVHGNKCWMLYSANAYLNVNYFIGTSVANNKENMLDMEWGKYPNNYTWAPLLRKNEWVEGTGHNTVTKAPNMVDDWIVYHGRNAEEELNSDIEQREMYIDKLYFNGEQMICFGPSRYELEAPKGPEFEIYDEKVVEKMLLSESKLYYHIEFWISAYKNHTGIRYGIYLEYQDEMNYLEMRIHTGKNEVQVWSCKEGICVLILTRKLPHSYNYTVPHFICVERKFNNYSIVLDNDKAIEFSEFYKYEKGFIGIIPYFSQIILHNFALTESLMLKEKNLQSLSHFYEVSFAMVDEEGLCAIEEEIILKRKKLDDNYTEEFLFKINKNENKIFYKQNNISNILASNKKEIYSIYHIVHGQKELFIVDGEKYEFQTMKQNDYTLVIKGTKILHYQYTKN